MRQCTCKRPRKEDNKAFNKFSHLCVRRLKTRQCRLHFTEAQGLIAIDPFWNIEWLFTACLSTRASALNWIRISITISTLYFALRRAIPQNCTPNWLDYKNASAQSLYELRRAIDSILAAVGTIRLSMCRPKHNTINRNRLEHCI